MKLPARLRSLSLPLSGVGPVGTGILVAGVFTYLFLSLAGRVLGPAAFAPVSTLWSVVFIVGPGLFMPVQQELGRLIAGRRADRSGQQAVRRIGTVAAAMSLGTVVATLAARDWMVEALFDGHWSLLWCFLGAVLSYALTFLARGVFSGLGDFGDYGRLVATESVFRLAVGAVLALAGGRSASSFGIAIAVAPLLSAAVVTRLGTRLRLAPGPPLTWRQATRAMGWLVVGSVLAQVLANAGPVLVQVLATPAEENQAGRFLSALVLARLSLYLFQAVQATLLPNLAELVAAGRIDEVRRALRRLTAACGVLVVVTSVGAYLLGPLAVRLLFGDQFILTRSTMAMLAGASSLYVLAIALSGAAIAAHGYQLNAVGWLLGAAGFVVGSLLSDDLFLRVQIGYLLGSTVAAGVLLLGLPRHLRRHQGEGGEPAETWSAASP